MSTLQAILVAYLAMSTVTFIAYARDKSAARAGRWRISERALHLLELLGGWPGGLLAQHTLRHKRRKSTFLVIFWLIVAIHMGFWIWAWRIFTSA